MVLLLLIPLFTLDSIYSTNMLVGPSKCLKQIIQIELNRVKNPNWPEANELAIYEHGRGLNSGLLWTNPASGQGGTWTLGLRIASPALKPLGHAEKKATMPKEEVNFLSLRRVKFLKIAILFPLIILLFSILFYSCVSICKMEFKLLSISSVWNSVFEFLSSEMCVRFSLYSTSDWIFL